MKKMMRESPSQTAGPYVHIGCAPSAAGINAYGEELGARDLKKAVEGQAITLTGTIFDGDAEPVSDAMVEIWHADAVGNFSNRASDNGFAGFGRTTCDRKGGFQFELIKPGATEQSPHVTIWIVARGINLGLHTRAYFDGDDHDSDAVLEMVPSDRRGTLIARGTGPDTFHIDIHLQGPKETVFFDI